MSNDELEDRLGGLFSGISGAVPDDVALGDTRQAPDLPPSGDPRQAEDEGTLSEQDPAELVQDRAESVRGQDVIPIAPQYARHADLSKNGLFSSEPSVLPASEVSSTSSRYPTGKAPASVARSKVTPRPRMSNANRRYPSLVEWTDSPSDKLHRTRTILAVILVVGLIVGINFVLFNPTARGRAEYLVLRAQTYINKLRPHDRYIPTPYLHTPQVSATAVTGQAAATPTVAPTTTPTTIPTTAPLSKAEPSPAPPLTATPLPVSVVLETECHEPQGWNNCGPATLSMALCFYGWTDDQYAIAAALKPDKNDKNVSPLEMVSYAFSLGDMYAVTGYAADIQVLKSLLSSGFPVIVETWFIPEPDDEMGHYRLLTGYDDTAQAFAAQDAYNGPAQRVSYDELDALWKVFNRAYVVVTETERAQALTALLGEALEPETMYGNALAVALSETAADAEDRYAWFNMGNNYVGLGRYQEAAEAYDRARMLRLPWRMLWYQFGPFEAYLHVGRYQDVIDLTNANLEVTKNLEESYYYRALARRAGGDQAGARGDLQKALQYNPLYDRAAKALAE